VTAETRYFEGVADLVPVLLAAIDLRSNAVLDVNAYGLEMLGYSRDALVGHDYGDVVHDFDSRPEDADRSTAGNQLSLERRLKYADGSFVRYSLSAKVLPDNPEVLLVSGRPLQDLTYGDSSLADLMTLAELTDDIFVVTDEHGMIRYVNGAAARLHGPRTFVGHSVSDFLHESDTSLPKLEAAFTNEDHKVEVRGIGVGPDGDPIHLSIQTVYDPMSRRWCTVERNIQGLIATEERLARLAEDLRIRATTDDLTGVANRAALNDLLDLACSGDRSFGLLLLDMDDFKSVNDTLGHAAGDVFLTVVAKRLSDVAASDGVVARLGGDEFVILLPDVDELGAATIASNVIGSISDPYTIHGVAISRSCSIGVAISEPGDDPSAVLRRADQAAYEAKHAGRSRFRVHNGPSESWPANNHFSPVAHRRRPHELRALE